MKYTNEEVSALLGLAMLGGIVEALEKEAKEEEEEEVVTETITRKDVPAEDNVVDFVLRKEMAATTQNAVLDLSDFIADDETKVESIKGNNISITFEGMVIEGQKDDVLDVIGKLANGFPMKG